MRPAAHTLRFIALGFAALVLGALGVWYIVLSERTKSIGELGEARGFGESIPSFSSSAGGSTFKNIVSGVDTEAPLVGGKAGELPRLWHVTSIPAAGIGFVGSSSPALRFVERSTGYIFETRPETGEVRRITNTLVPKVYEALIAENGNTILRYLDETGVSTFSGVVSATSSEIGTLAGRELPKHIAAITFAPGGKNILYVVSDGAGGFSIVRADASGANPQKLSATALSGWRLSWLGGGIRLTQKGADNIPGSAYELVDGNLSPLINSVPGLSTAFDQDSPAILYSASGESGLHLSARSGETATPVSFPIKTVAEKCVWETRANLTALCGVPQNIPSKSFLNDWYRGLAHTSDSWWRVDARDGTATLLLSGEAHGTMPGVDRPIIDQRGEYVAFIDARDESVWLLRIRP